MQLISNPTSVEPYHNNNIHASSSFVSAISSILELYESITTSL